MNSARRIPLRPYELPQGAKSHFANHAPLRRRAVFAKAAVFAAIGMFLGVPDKLIAAELPVHVISTFHDSGGSIQAKYPRTVSLKVPERLKDSVSAYGAVARIWLAPKGWVGTAAQGADGSTSVELRPHFGHSRSGPYVTYRDDGGCAGCALLDAARYFPNAKRQFEKLFGDDRGKTPAGLEIHRISSHLVTFRFLSTAGRNVRGAAFYSGNSDYQFTQMIVDLPRFDAALTQFLLRHFIAGFRSMDDGKIR